MERSRASRVATAGSAHSMTRSRPRSRTCPARPRRRQAARGPSTGRHARRARPGRWRARGRAACVDSRHEARRRQCPHLVGGAGGEGIEHDPVCLGEVGGDDVEVGEHLEGAAYGGGRCGCVRGGQTCRRRRRGVFVAQPGAHRSGSARRSSPRPTCAGSRRGRGRAERSRHRAIRGWRRIRKEWRGCSGLRGSASRGTPRSRGCRIPDRRDTASRARVPNGRSSGSRLRCAFWRTTRRHRSIRRAGRGRARPPRRGVAARPQ